MPSDSENMTCQEVVEFLMAYLDAELPGVEREVFEEPLHLCPPCQAYLDTYRDAVEMGRRACGEPEAIEPAPDELIDAILAARQRARD